MLPAVGAAAALGSTALQNQSNAERESLARKENYEYNERAAQNAANRALGLYHATASWKAQVDQLEEAGLSPGLLLSGGGTGGTAAAPQGGADVQPIPAVNLMEKAQVALMAAQVEKVKAETSNISEDTTLKKLEQTTQNWINNMKSEEYEQAKTASKQMLEQLRIMINDADISDATKEQRINTMKNQLIAESAKALQEEKLANETTQDLIDKIKAETSTAKLKVLISDLERQVFKNMHLVYLDKEDGDSNGWTTYKRIMRRVNELFEPLTGVAEAASKFVTKGK